jgi:hypothetical protein
MIMRNKATLMTWTAGMLWVGMTLHGATLNGQANATRTIPAPPPPMGWSSWNSFSNTLDSQIVMEQARTMAANGMQKAGYTYINIDEGWWLGKRDAEGNFVVDEKAWPALKDGEKPGDMGNIARFIHSLGLKAGIYTDAGSNGCSMYPDLGPVYPNVGSEGHYEQDFLQFARWGFDYVKVDWCGGDKENLDPAVQYGEIARAIAHAERITGHSLYFSICNWGKNSPWTWGPHVGGVVADIWRTSGDIVAPIVASGKNSGRKAGFEKMLGNFDQGVHPEAQHTGFYNDPDMMVLAMPGFSEAQNRTHMSLWAMSGAPLLVGADLTKLSPEAIGTLTNAAVVAVDQDELGLQAVKVLEPAQGLQVWVKPLAKTGTRAVLLLNRTAAPADLPFDLKDLDLSGPATAQDLWSGREPETVQGTFSAKVPAGEAILLLIKGTDRPDVLYRPAAGGKLEEKDGRACDECDVTFAHVASHSAWSRIKVIYKNPGKATRFAELHVNGQIATHVAFPPTGPQGGSVSILARLDRVEANNVLRFSADGKDAPQIDSISAQ